MNYTPPCLLGEEGICIQAKGTDTQPLRRKTNLCIQPLFVLSLSLCSVEMDSQPYVTFRSRETEEYSIISKVKFSLCLTKHHAIKAYWGMEV
jgi:hypothetical protein